MSSDNKFSNDRNTASAARSRDLPKTPRKSGLSLSVESLKPTQQERSSDPYNTSGSFDRTKNWARVGKR
jgi:hypothetical protein